MVLVFMAIGLLTLVFTRAATPTAAFEAEDGSASGAASVVSDASASAAQAIKFGSGQVSTQTNNCAPNPHLCGFPDSTNTGVPAGTTLTNVPGQATSGNGWHWHSGYQLLIIDGAGATVSNLNVNGCVNIAASNVTFKNSRVTNNGGCNAVLYVVYYLGLSNITISHVELDGKKLLGSGNGSTPGISGGWLSATLSYLYVHGTGDGIDPGGPSVITDSYIGDAWVHTGDHVDGIQTNSGNDLTVTHCTVDNTTGNDSPLIIGGDAGNFTNGLFSNNLLIPKPDQPAIRAGHNKGDSNKVKNLRFINNRIAVGSAYNFIPDGTNPIVFTGNVHDSNGSPYADFNSAGDGNTQYAL